jgi:hypothetical protein
MDEWRLFTATTISHSVSARRAIVLTPPAAAAIF